MAGHYVEATSKPMRGGHAKKLDHLRVYPGENGGHSIEHHFAGSGKQMPEPEKHNFGPNDGEAAINHIMEAANINPQGAGTEEPENAQAAAAQTAPAQG